MTRLLLLLLLPLLLLPLLPLPTSALKTIAPATVAVAVEAKTSVVVRFTATNDAGGAVRVALAGASVPGVAAATAAFVVVPPNEARPVDVALSAPVDSGSRVDATLSFEWRDDATLALLQTTAVQVALTPVAVSVHPLDFTLLVPNGTVATNNEVEVWNVECDAPLTWLPVVANAPDNDWLSLAPDAPTSVQQILPNRGLPDLFRFVVDTTKLPPPTDPLAAVPTLQTSITVAATSLGVPLNRTVAVSLRVYSLCPSGTYSASGTTLQACRACPFGTYQPSSGKIACIACPEKLPITLISGATSSDACTSKPGDYKKNDSVSAPCPRGANCSGAGTTVQTLTLDDGFWRPNPDSDAVQRCTQRPTYCRGGRFSPTAAPALTPATRRFLLTQNQSQTQTQPQPSNETNDLCIPHHTGVLCESCEPGYFKQGSNRQCDACTPDDTSADIGKTAGVVVALVLTPVVLLGVQLSLSRKWRQRNDETMRTLVEWYDWYEDFKTKLHVAVGFYQVLVISVRAFVNIFPPTFFDRLSQAAFILFLQFTKAVDLGCAAETSFFSDLVVSTLTPMVLLASLFITERIVERVVVGPLNRVADTPDMSTRRAELRSYAAAIALLVTFLIYPETSSTVLKTFRCEVVPGTSISTMHFDHSIRCDSAMYASMTAYAAVMTVVFPIGIPLLYMYILWTQRLRLNPPPETTPGRASALREHDPKLAYSRFLWNPYRPKMYAWEVAELARKLLQTAVMEIFFDEGSVSQIMYLLSVTAMFVVVLHTFLPFETADNNALAIIGQWVLFFMCAACLLIRVSKVTNNSDLDVSVLQTLLCVLLFVVPATIVLLAVKRLVKLGLHRRLMPCLPWSRWFPASKEPPTSSLRWIREIVATGRVDDDEDEGWYASEGAIPDWRRGDESLDALRDAHLGTLSYEALMERTKEIQDKLASVQAKMEAQTSTTHEFRRELAQKTHETTRAKSAVMTALAEADSLEMALQAHVRASRRVSRMRARGAAARDQSSGGAALQPRPGAAGAESTS